MVASYSPTSGYRSSGRHSLISHVTQSAKDSLIYLRAVLSPQTQCHPSLTPSFDDSSKTISQLATLAHNTFGNQWLTLIEREEPQDNTTPYACCLHSLHVLTSYDTDLIGQAELQAFLFGATGHINSLIQCLKYWHTSNGHHTQQPSSLETNTLGSRLYRAYQRGRASYFDLGNWHPEQLWDLPLPYVRQWFGIPE